METDGVVVRDERARPLWRLRCEAPPSTRKAEPVEGAHANVVVGEDEDVAARERLVPPDVVGVHVGVDQETDRLVRHAPHGADQPVREGREQRVDQQHAVVAGEDAHVAAPARARDHVHLPRDGHDLELDARERIALGLAAGGRHQGRGACAREGRGEDAGLPERSVHGDLLGGFTLARAACVAVPPSGPWPSYGEPPAVTSRRVTRSQPLRGPRRPAGGTR